MKFGYFTLTDNPPNYGDKRRDAGQFLHEVIAESVHAEDIGLNSVCPGEASGTIPAIRLESFGG